MHLTTTLIAASAWTGAVLASPISDITTTPKSAYAPVSVSCPDESLNRVASGLHPSESAYISSRRANADTALAAWIKKVDPSFDTTTLPVVGLAVSGGSFRSMLTGGGVVQAFDSRDSNSTTSGIFQGLTYFSSLSGGSWLLSSLIGNNWPTVSDLRDNLWGPNLANNLFLPGGSNATQNDKKIANDIGAKAKAGFPTTIADSWGRLLSYQLFKGADGGAAKRLSALKTYTNSTAYDVPLPILTSVGVLPNACAGPANSTQYEFTPYEFGSWDQGVNAFTNVGYLGTRMKNNSPASNQCTTHFDNLGFVASSSSDYFGGVCGETTGLVAAAIGFLQTLVSTAKGAKTVTYAALPNPFYKSAGSPLLSARPQIHLTDGGLSGQEDPIWPFLQKARDVDFLIINDNSADTAQNLPNGTSLRQTWQRAKKVGLLKMPEIPPVKTILAKRLNTQATFFGCNEPYTMTIVWIPNVPYISGTNTSTSQVQYTQEQTASLINNGNHVATQNGNTQWPVCLACAMQKKTGTTLPASCAACFKKHCYTP
ncbi:lysophospholipase [Myriangium duriaei CBS 260.36]|uniref:Lysophospholipase n=1 Tax=Myriangium duriaei CBS 260.36 TaxID=1168546 RepID=A0A9P4IZL7_9PEZI|nr:lysophospholipase [Myriangium duriaei CBS 260.36]